MNREIIRAALLVNILEALQKYNNSPCFSTEDEFYYLVDSYNELVRKTNVETIEIYRNETISSYSSPSVVYIPFGNIQI